MSTLSFDYSLEYEPAAPVLEVGLHSYHQDSSPYIGTALIDTGADGTLVPLSILQNIHAGFLHMRTLRGVTGVSQKVPMYLVKISLGRHILPGIQVAGLRSADEIILGRDALNQLRLTLDGLSAETVIELFE